MLQLTIAHPTSLTSSKVQENLFYDLKRSLFYPNVDFSIKNKPFHSVSPNGLPFLIHPSISPTSFGFQDLQPLHIQSLPWNLFHLFSITYHYNLRHNSPHTHATFLFHVWFSNVVTTFEANPYPQQYHLQVHSATSLRLGNIGILVRILNRFFLMFFKTVPHITKHSTGTRSIGFHSYSQELVYMCSCYNFVCSLYTQ